MVSIHAPAWGATYAVPMSYHFRAFQSTRPRGARHCALAVPNLANVFQSTRPRGARQRSVSYNRSILGFNPRARVGRDTAMTASVCVFDVSIHAPAWGATVVLPFLLASKVFQSTRPRGARQLRRPPFSRQVKPTDSFSYRRIASYFITPITLIAFLNNIHLV